MTVIIGWGEARVCKPKNSKMKMRRKTKVPLKWTRSWKRWRKRPHLVQHNNRQCLRIIKLRTHFKPSRCWIKCVICNNSSSHRSICPNLHKFRLDNKDRQLLRIKFQTCKWRALCGWFRIRSSRFKSNMGFQHSHRRSQRRPPCHNNNFHRWIILRWIVWSNRYSRLKLWYNNSKLSLSHRSNRSFS